MLFVLRAITDNMPPIKNVYTICNRTLPISMFVKIFVKWNNANTAEEINADKKCLSLLFLKISNNRNNKTPLKTISSTKAIPKT